MTEDLLKSWRENYTAALPPILNHPKFSSAFSIFLSILCPQFQNRIVPPRDWLQTENWCQKHMNQGLWVWDRKVERMALPVFQHHCSLRVYYYLSESISNERKAIIWPAWVNLKRTQPTIYAVWVETRCTSRAIGNICMMFKY